MGRERSNQFWYSYLIMSAVAVAILPIATNAFIDYGERAVDVYATSTVTDAGAPAVAILARNKTALPLNAFELELAFDPAQLQLGSSTIQSPLCEERFVITHEVNNQNGTALIQCGTITPFTGTSTTLAIFELTTTTTVSLTFGERTSVLAHDGYGTNVTGSTTLAF